MFLYKDMVIYFETMTTTTIDLEKWEELKIHLIMTSTDVQRRTLKSFINEAVREKMEREQSKQISEEADP